MRFVKRVFIIIVLLAGFLTCLVRINPGNAASTEIISDLINIPNPFNAGAESTLIRYNLSEDCSISINIYNLIGDMVKQFNEDECSGISGAQESVEWDGRNGKGMEVADGCYICEIFARDSEGLLLDNMLLKIAVLK